MSSSNVNAERSLRLVLKLAQLLASLYLIIAMYNIGPHWVLLVASLLVPLYGLFLLFRSPERILRQHPLPYVRYKALARARSWLRVDLAICATMAVVCLAFATVLLFGYFQIHSANSFLLQAAVAALLLSLLYSLNSLLSVRQLQMGRVDLLAEKNASISTTRASTQSPIGEPAMPAMNMAEPPETNGLQYKVFGDGWKSPERPISVQSPPTTSTTSQPQSAVPSLLEQLQSELAHEYARGRWRHIPIEMEEHAKVSLPAQLDEGQRVERKVKVEQRRSMPYGVDLGAFGSREQKWMPAKWDEDEGERSRENGRFAREKQTKEESSFGQAFGQTFGQSGQQQGKMLPRLSVQRNGCGRIRGEWSGTVGDKKDQLASQALPPFPASSTSSSENGQLQGGELRRTIERKRVRYETVASKTLVDVDRERPTPTGQCERRDFDVSIRPRTSPFRKSTELRLHDDRRPTAPHQVTEL